MAVVVESTESSDSGSGSGNHAVNLPSGTSEGDVIVACIAADGTGTVTFPDSGWDALFTNSANGVRMSIGTWTAPASPGTTFNINLGAGEPWRSCSYRISGAEGPDGSYAPEVSTGASGSSATPDPDSVTASGVTGDTNLFIGCCAVDRRTITGFPANCADSQINNDSGGSQEASAGMASDILTQDTFNPDTFACTSDGWVAATVVVFPTQPAPPVTISDTISESDSVTPNPVLSVTAGLSDTIQDRDWDNTPVLTLIRTLTNTAQNGLANLDKDSGITGDLTATSGTIEYLSDTISEADAVTPNPVLSLTAKLSETIDGDADAVTPNPVLSVLAKLAEVIDGDADTVPNSVLSVLADLAEVITDRDVVPGGPLTLSSLKKLSDSITEADTVPNSVMSLTAKLAEVIDGDVDSLTEANLVIVGAVTKMTVTISESDSWANSVLIAFGKMADTIAEADTLVEKKLDSLVKMTLGGLGFIGEEDDFAAPPVMVAVTSMSDTIAEADSITEAALVNPVKIAASIQEWPDGAGGGGPYATGIIIG